MQIKLEDLTNVPNGHDGVRQKFASIQQLATITIFTTDSFTQLNQLRYELNRILKPRFPFYSQSINKKRTIS